MASVEFNELSFVEKLVNGTGTLICSLAAGTLGGTLAIGSQPQTHASVVMLASVATAFVIGSAGLGAAYLTTSKAAHGSKSMFVGGLVGIAGAMGLSAYLTSVAANNPKNTWITSQIVEPGTVYEAPLADALRFTVG